MGPAVIEISPNCVPDFRYSTLPGHFSTENIYAELRREKIYFIFYEAKDKEDVERLCRLKELATRNQERERALAFNADELRARRKFGNCKETAFSLPDILYSGISNYGQSMIRPFIGLTSIFTLTWLGLSWLGGCGYGEAFVYAINHALPLLNLGGGFWDSFWTGFLNYPCQLPVILLIFYKIFALMFLFLFGLGIRNRFRL